MSQDPRDVDPDDFFSETRMSFGDHLEDLRLHLWRAVKGFFFACVLGFIIGKDVLVFIAHPVEVELEAFHKRRVEAEKKKLEDGDERLTEINKPSAWEQREFDVGQLRALLKGGNDGLKEANGWEKPDDDPTPGTVSKLWVRDPAPLSSAFNMEKVLSIVGKRPVLSTLSVQEAFVVYMKVSLVTGFVLGAPWIFYQVWSFIAVGLYPHEKRLVNVYLPFSLGLFLVGVLVCQFLVIPKSIEALLWFNEWIGLEPDLRLSEWLGFAIMMPVVFGISFQTPLAMLFVYRIGLFSIDSFRNKRRIIWFLMAVFAAIITPSTDPYSMMFLWVPMCLLFELGIYLCMMYPQPTYDEDDDDGWEGMIEV
jgi:sec-independent protein translocase protein TatC